jgi:hypothetical protein
MRDTLGNKITGEQTHAVSLLLGHQILYRGLSVDPGKEEPSQDPSSRCRYLRSARWFLGEVGIPEAASTRDIGWGSFRELERLETQVVQAKSGVKGRVTPVGNFMIE